MSALGVLRKDLENQIINQLKVARHKLGKMK